jgi:hypothetical protein
VREGEVWDKEVVEAEVFGLEIEDLGGVGGVLGAYLMCWDDGAAQIGICR